jgi:hypothetical protein
MTVKNQELSGGFLSDNVSYMILRYQAKLTSLHNQAHN